MQQGRRETVFNYSSYRTFLADHFAALKKKNAAWSYGAWAHKLGLRNNTSILKVVNGQREAGPEICHKLIDYFRFSDSERAYFLDLVQLSKSKKNPALYVLLAQKVAQQMGGRAPRILDDREFAAISQWWHLAIRQMTQLRDFDPAPEAMARRLRCRVLPRELKRAVETLLDLGLLKRAADGRLTTGDRDLVTQDGVANEAIKRFHEAQLEHARAAIRSVDIDERQIRGTTLAVARGDLPAAQQMIRKFETEFTRVFGRSADADEVYQIQVQFFPLTRSTKTKTKGSSK